MNATTIMFDGRNIFGGGQHQLTPLSWRRETVDYGFSGLDGVVSIDSGLRGRKLKQHGTLTAKSVAALTELMETISGYIDGQGYKLVDQNGISYGNVRMDSFTPSGPVAVGNQACCEYEIRYTQLSD